MPQTYFTHKGQRYILTAFGLRLEYYGHAWKDGTPQKPQTAIASTAARSYEGVYDLLRTAIKEQVDAHHYMIGGEPLTGTVRKGVTLKPTYIGKLAFADQPPRKGRAIKYVEAPTEEEAYEALDAEARTFAERDGFELIILGEQDHVHP